MIRRNIELESQLIDDLLDLTRIAKDKLQLPASDRSMLTKSSTTSSRFDGRKRTRAI